MASVVFSAAACPSPRACRMTGMRSCLARELPHVWEQMLSSGDHALGEVLVEEEAFRLHRTRRPNDGVTVLERRELDHDGPFALGRCRGSSAMGPFNLDSADLVCWQLQLSLDDLPKRCLCLLPRLPGLLLHAVYSQVIPP